MELWLALEKDVYDDDPDQGLAMCARLLARLCRDAGIDVRQYLIKAPW